jgi:hypothetical protein
MIGTYVRGGDVPITPGWSAGDAVLACPTISWESEVTRFHARRYPATDPGGSLRFPGRYHRDWPTLYTCIRPEAVIGEFLRHSTPSALSRLAVMRLSTLSVRLEALMDCRDASLMGLDRETLLHDIDYDLTQAVGEAALTRGVEGILVPSATRLGDNLILWVAQIRPGSQIAVIRSEDPRLYVPRP